MRKLIIMAIALFLFAGCEGTIDSSGGNSSSNIRTISIGLTGRNYEYAEVFDNTGSMFKMYYTATNLISDTMFIDVPDVDTIIMIAYNVSESDDDYYNLVRFAPVADSVYKFRF